MSGYRTTPISRLTGRVCHFHSRTPSDIFKVFHSGRDTEDRLSGNVPNGIPRVGAGPAFAGVAAADLSRMFAVAIRLTLRDEDTVFARGDPASSVYVVLSGAARITTMASTGKRITVEIFQRDELVGEIGAIDGGVRSADASAMGPLGLVSIPASTFREVLAASAPLANNLLRLSLARLRRTYSLLERASLRTVEARFAKQVVKLGATGDVRSAPAGPDAPGRTRRPARGDDAEHHQHPQ